MKEQSPFTPGTPVPLELFVGREEQIEEIVRYIKQTEAGRQENVFLSGVRGIGKSSMASFLRELASTRHGMVGIHVFLGGVSTLEEMVRHIFDKLLEQTRDKEWFGRISKFFGNHIKQIGLFGITATFAPPKEDLSELVRRFPQVLHNLLEEIRKNKKGLFIVLDDINGLAEQPGFAHWYKSFVDDRATHYKDFPVTFVLTGLPEKRDSLSALQPSLMRVFRVVKIEELASEEVAGFFRDAFKKVDMSVNADALATMVRFSSGLPFLMHEIGDAVYHADSDNKIDRDDCLAGLTRAAANVAAKYLEPKVYNAMQSPRYRSILRKVGLTSSGKGFAGFTKKEVEKNLDADEKRVFHNFLKKMREFGVIAQDKDLGPGAYVFTNMIYGLCIGTEGIGHHAAASIWAPNAG